MKKIGRMLAILTIFGFGLMMLAPGGEGGGQQTGTISGRVFKPNLSGLPYANVWVLLDPGDPDSKIDGSTDGDGFYMFSAIPAGTGYKVCAKKLPNWCKRCVSDVNVTAGQNTTVDIIVVPCD